MSTQERLITVPHSSTRSVAKLVAETVGIGTEGLIFKEAARLFMCSADSGILVYGDKESAGMYGSFGSKESLFQVIRLGRYEAFPANWFERLYVEWDKKLRLVITDSYKITSEGIDFHDDLEDRVRLLTHESGFAFQLHKGLDWIVRKVNIPRTAYVQSP